MKMTKIPILICIDDIEIANTVINIINKYDEYKIVEITNNREFVTKAIPVYQPSIVVLCQTSLAKKTNIADLLKRQEKLDTPYLICIGEGSGKIPVDYMIQEIEMLESRLEFILKMIPNFIDNRDMIKRKIAGELDKIGIHKKDTGYEYLINAILLKLKNTKEKPLSIIARNYEKTESSIERAIQNAINKAWEITDAKLWLESGIINDINKKPTISDVVNCSAINLHICK